MTLTHAFLSFAAVAGLLTIIPGLDTAIVVRTALTQGRARACAAAVGIGTGSLIWGVAAATGVSVLLTASHTAYLALRVLGAGYLVWMGGRMLIDALRRKGTGGDPADDEAGGRRRGVAHAWSRGLATNLLNPKIGVFYVAMLPQFIPAGAPHLLIGAALALVHDVEGMVWFAAVILTAHSARRLFAGGMVKRVMDAVTGSALVGFGARLAASRG